MTGLIYVANFDGKIKVGYSTNITQRFRAHRYQNSSVILLKSVAGSLEKERLLHRRLKNYRVKGFFNGYRHREIYDLPEDILNTIIKELTEDENRAPHSY